MLKKQMESVSVIVMTQVTELVQKDIILQDKRKTDNIEIEVDISLGRTASPIRGIVLYSHPVVCKSISLSQFRQSDRELCLSLSPKFFDLRGRRN